MNNPNDNARSSDGNYGKKIPSVAAGKKREMAKKMTGAVEAKKGKKVLAVGKIERSSSGGYDTTVKTERGTINRTAGTRHHSLANALSSDYYVRTGRHPHNKAKLK